MARCQCAYHRRPKRNHRIQRRFGATAAISRVTITGGEPAIGNLGSLTLSKSTISNNHCGGIYEDGDLSIVDSTISGNSYIGNGGLGGGIQCGQYANLSIVGSTITGNSATYVGGGI